MKEIYRQLRGISSDRVIGLGPNKILVRARRGGHRDRALDAGEAGHSAGAAAGRPASAEPAPVVRPAGGGCRALAASRSCSAACRKPSRAPVRTADRSSNSPRGA